jgi:Zn-dependent peptidase ImmA (M78 family)
MKIPKTIMVFGKKFKVKIIDTHEFAGMMDAEKGVIYLSVHQTKEQMLSTYFHEIFHALHYRIGLNQALSRDMMEVLAESQATLMMEILTLK